jgi:hypothetical protein
MELRPDTKPGGGRDSKCLNGHKEQLSAECRQAFGSMEQAKG